MDALAITPGLIAACVVVLLAAILRGVTGFGFAIAAMPFLSLALDPKLAVGLAVLLQLLIGVVEAPRAWALADRSALRPLIAGCVLATPFGLAALALLPTPAVRLAVAAVCALALYVVWRGPRLRGADALTGRPLLTGAGAGFLNGLSAMPGPPVIMFFLTGTADRAAARASMTVFFGATAAVATAMALIGGQFTAAHAWTAAACAPALLIGGRIGDWLFHRIDAAAYRNAALLTLALGAVAAAVRGVFG